VSAVCLIGGCQVHRLCAPITGTVIDTDTKKPIENAKVTVAYVWKKTRVTHTNSEGRFAFGAYYKIWPLFPLNLSRVIGVREIRMESPGHDPVDINGWMCLIEHRPSRPGYLSPKLTGVNNEIQIEPVELKPVDSP
jgi:hypothetical protein